MKKLIFIITVFCSCSSTRKNYDNYHRDQKENYFVSKIDSINNYYLIYAERNDSIFKIVSEKSKSSKNCNKIELRQSYKFSLTSYRKNAIKINGINPIPINVQSFGMDEETFISLEREKGINDLHFTNDLIGLCLKNTN